MCVVGWVVKCIMYEKMCICILLTTIFKHNEQMEKFQKTSEKEILCLFSEGESSRMCFMGEKKIHGCKLKGIFTL